MIPEVCLTTLPVLPRMLSYVEEGLGVVVGVNTRVFGVGAGDFRPDAPDLKSNVFPVGGVI